uniref:2,4-dienoyl-CoA reductase n=1 Tax=Panagrolaimus sp. JU765 TaxID=591449 RepID=A0AC34RQ84_9BILA
MAYCKNPEKYFPIKKTPALVAGALTGKLALITGGGTGLGKAMATTFSALGADLDVRQPEAINASFDEIQKKFGRLPNIVVNNAAGNFIMATERLSPNAIKTVVEIVLLGTTNMTVELGRRIIKDPKSDGCTFLNITTPYARHGSAFVVPSAISKAGVENLVRSLTSEWSRFGMRFMAIAPGPIPTEGAFGRLSAGPVAEMKEGAAQFVPEGRCGAPEELANLAAFVCSDFGSWLNGAIIDFDGGQQFLGQGSSIGGTAYHEFSHETWAMIEDTIRGRTGKEKSKI